MSKEPQVLLRMAGTLKSISVAGSISGHLSAAGAIGSLTAKSIRGRVSAGQDLKGSSLGKLTLGQDVGGLELRAEGRIGSVAVKGSRGPAIIAAPARTLQKLCQGQYALPFLLDIAFVPPGSWSDIAEADRHASHGEGGRGAGKPKAGDVIIRYRQRNRNLRTQLMRIVKAAKL